MKLPRLILCLALLTPLSTAKAEEAAPGAAIGALAGGPLSTAKAENTPPLSAAVLDFREADPALEGKGASVATLLQVKLSTVSEAMLVERTELNEILAEHELTLSDAVAPAQAAKVGQLTGAEVIITGRVFNIQDRTHLVAKVVSTSSGRVFGATTDFEKNGKLDAAVEALAVKVAGLLKDKVADLRGAKPLEERQLEALKGKLKGQPARKAYISVKEAILQATTPDPAAQTELRRTLQLAGWTIVENEGDAEVLIHGEAFAETGIRRGNLWFTRARLEFTVKDHAGKILATERIVAGNVDLTQLISSKGALQKTGLLASTVAVDAWLASLKPKPN
ncbi:MAG: CsgG/HfaB family protein [Verrucomicrobiota bacterium]